ncbi:MAG TPA: ATP-binding protein [Verrucomicrobiae bacterium]|nr:ATP-binding protein [Verrucomicrobiae bacterium]
MVARTHTMRGRLMQVAVAGLLPVTMAAGAALWALVSDQLRAAEDKSLEVTRLAAAAIDLEIQRAIATLQVAAASPLLDRKNLDQYILLMRRTHEQMPGWHRILLSTGDGVPVLHTGAGDPAVDSQAESESLHRAVTELRPAVGRLRRLPDGTWIAPVSVPVLRENRLDYVLTGMLTPSAFMEVVRAQNLPSDWIMSVFDATGTRVARSHNHEGTVGKTAAPSLQDLMQSSEREGVGITRTLENTEVYTAFVRMPTSGWSVAIGIPTETVQAGAWRAIAVYGGGTLVSLLLALLWAALASRHIEGPIGGLRAVAEGIGRGERPVPPATEIRELRELGEALVASFAERNRFETERREALAQLTVARDDLKMQVADLERLRQLSNHLLVLPGIDAQLQAVLLALCQLHGSSKGLVSLCTDRHGQLEVRGSMGFSRDALEQLRITAPGESPCDLALRNESRVVVADMEVDPAYIQFREMARAGGFRSVHATPIRGSAGRVLGVISVHGTEPGQPTERHARLADVCAQICSVFLERSKAEADAAESELRLAVALDSSTVPFSVMTPVRDPTGVIVDFTWDYVNSASATHTRRQVHEMLGQAVGNVAPETWRIPGLFEALTAVAESGRTRELEVGTVDSAPERFLHVVATPMMGKVAVWSSDVTHRKEQERALQAADRRKDEFLAVLAHELRNPLAPIQQAAMISNAPHATESQKRWSHEVIQRQVKHMALLLEDLLDVSRITRGKLELRKSAVELRSAIDAAVETARPHIEAKQHRLLCELPPEPIRLQADALRIAQVVTNLLTNAARYTDAGGTIRVKAGSGEGRAWVTVEDTGIGIAPEHLDSIFEMFSQGREGTTHGGGLGIGLALSRGIAQLHGGTLSASSLGGGQGSRFTLVLPLGATAAAPLPQRDEQPAPHTGGLRILIADDNRDAAETLSSVLRLSGHWTVLTYDGNAAVAAYERHRPDLAILDIGMPGMSGYEVARAIRERSTGQTSPVLVALTGWGQAKDKASAAGAGFDYHLTKPVDMKALFEILRARKPTAASLSVVKR